MKKIYICHQYYEPTHFKALYDCAQNYGYQVMDLIVLNPVSAIKHRQKIIEQQGIKAADEWYNRNFVNQGNLWLLKDEIVIIGVAPYDRLLAQYQVVLRENHSIYMTSWTNWHSDDVPYPYKDNKAGFMETLINDINGVACVSKKAESEISSWNSTTQVVNHAIDIENYVCKKTFIRKGKYVFLGRLIELKNIDVIIKYLKEHPRKKISIDFIGDGALKNTLSQYADNDKRIRLLGYMSKKEIKNKLHEYDYLILPSHHEAFGIALLEALAGGVPCIVSDTDGSSEIISQNKNGIVFQLSDTSGFERAMDYSMDMSDEQYISMCDNAIAESKKYDVKEVVKKWISLFERTCGE